MTLDPSIRMLSLSIILIPILVALKLRSIKLKSQSNLLLPNAWTNLGGQFGCIPLTDFQLYTCPEVVWQSVPDIIQAHHLIISSGVSIFIGQRIPVTGNLNIPNWRQHLCDHFDQQLVNLIKFRSLNLISTFENHATAVEFDSHVKEYIREELQHGALLGLFHSPPFSLPISPSMIRPKSGSEVRRTILDLS